jgi:hypothetical protein
MSASGCFSSVRVGRKKIKKTLAIMKGEVILKSFWGEQKPVVAFAATGFNFIEGVTF